MKSFQIVLSLGLLAITSAEVQKITATKTSVTADGDDIRSGIKFTHRGQRPQFGTNGGQGSYNPDYNNGNGYPDYGNGNINQERVAFSVARASSYTRNAYTQIRFERTVTDIGYGWNGSTGKFECYYPGIYVFHWTAVSPQNTQFRISLAKNSVEKGHSWGHYDGYQSATNTVVLDLQRGDEVTLKLTEGSIYEPNSSNRGYTTFSGYRIF